MNDEQQKLNEVLMLFYFAYRTFTEKPDQMIAKYGIQRVHHRILFFIARIPGITVNELFTVLEVSKQAVNVPLRQLYEKGFIESEQAKFDKRYKQLFLTEKGYRLEQGLSRVQKEQMKEIFSSLGGDHQKAWMDVMKELAEVRPGRRQLEALFREKQTIDRIRQ